MQELDIDNIPKCFPLINNKATCYMNSLVQALVTCTSFGNVIINTNQQQYENRMLFIIFHKLFEKIYTGEYNIINFSNYLKMALTHELNMKQNNSILINNGQQGAHETFVTLIDILAETNKQVKDLFLVKYKMNIYCHNCRENVASKNDINIYIELFDYNGDSSLKMENLMKYKKSVPDYKCEKCNKKNCSIIYLLKGVSDIIVFLLKSYNKKNDHIFKCPDYLYIPTSLEKNKQFEYKLISSINHYGVMANGYSFGHYDCCALRQDDKKDFDFCVLNDEKSCQNNRKNDETTYMVFYHCNKMI
jgi:hypothetical protein